MRTIVLLFATYLALVAAVPQNPQRIVGGAVTTIDQYPFAAALLYTWNLVTFSQACGGTVLNNRSILTAAHCTSGDTASRWQSRLGSSYRSSGGIVYTSSAIINHPSYNAWTVDSDVSIIRTASAIALGSTIAAASIAGTTYNLADNQAVWAIGWGTTTVGGSVSEQLRHVQIWTVNQSTCASRYAEIGATITANMLCSGWLDVGGRDQCQGDSGGPLIHNNVIVGVCSWGYQCALARYPGVNARVSSFTAWIQANA